MSELYLVDGSKYSSPLDMQEKRLRELAPTSEVDELIREATQTVEDQLRLEDEGWINLSGTGGGVVSDAQRIINLKLPRLYYTKDPLGRQAIRLWTDYTFGSGMTFNASEKRTQEVLAGYWDAPENRAVLSARGNSETDWRRIRS